MSTHKPTVLLVDDEPGIARALAFALYEFDIQIVNDSRVALATLRTKDFDAVVTDMAMPHLSGVDLYNAVVALAPGLGARFIFISGGICSPEVERFLAKTGSICLDKPFSFDVLRDAVARVVEHAGPLAPRYAPREVA